MSHRRVAAIAASLVLVLTVAGCGGSSAPGAASAGDVRPTHLPVRAESVNSPLPEVVVRDLGASDWVQLKNALPSDRPVLVWFWAPH